MRRLVEPLMLQRAHNKHAADVILLDSSLREQFSALTEADRQASKSQQLFVARLCGVHFQGKTRLLETVLTSIPPLHVQLDMVVSALCINRTACTKHRPDINLTSFLQWQHPSPTCGGKTSRGREEGKSGGKEAVDCVLRVEKSTNFNLSAAENVLHDKWWHQPHRNRCIRLTATARDINHPRKTFCLFLVKAAQGCTLLNSNDFGWLSHSRTRPYRQLVDLPSSFVLNDL